MPKSDQEQPPILLQTAPEPRHGLHEAKELRRGGEGLQHGDLLQREVPESVYASGRELCAVESAREHPAGH